MATQYADALRNSIALVALRPGKAPLHTDQLACMGRFRGCSEAVFSQSSTHLGMVTPACLLSVRHDLA